MKKIFLMLLLLSFKVYANPLEDVEVTQILKCQGVIECQGNSSPGGPCHNGYGGPLYNGYGGRLYNGYGGPLYNGYGGPCASNSKTVLPLRCTTLCK